MSKIATSLRNCFFCGRHISAGTGIMLVKNDGSIQWTCSDKCKKNLRKLKRDPRKLKWTTKYVKGGIKVKKK
ncbi:MAG TPA: 50S ribosomal protein L24e [Nitrososphaeraceae archaeon]|jgi:large subunit ribosomal protein L24e|nr:50S ribosomal protein L24e [Nitrososphaeraceae archaeon]HEX2124609.1 50S ribosomal protein L24e [Nitrososphaeraceae archaeon]HZB98837.1 50S ribosomal protein L24e [Nitrososphaeraceae archaeon]